MDHEHGTKRRSDPSEIRLRLEKSRTDQEPVPFDPDETTDVLCVALQTVRKTLTEQNKQLGAIGQEIGDVAARFTRIPT
jgi:hypothetical protein